MKLKWLETETAKTFTIFHSHQCFPAFFRHNSEKIFQKLLVKCKVFRKYEDFNLNFQSFLVWKNISSLFFDSFSRTSLRLIDNKTHVKTNKTYKWTSKKLFQLFELRQVSRAFFCPRIKLNSEIYTLSLLLKSLICE